MEESMDTGQSTSIKVLLTWLSGAAIRPTGPLGPCELLHRLAVTPHWSLPSLSQILTDLFKTLELASSWLHRYLAGRGEMTGEHEVQYSLTMNEAASVFHILQGCRQGGRTYTVNAKNDSMPKNGRQERSSMHPLQPQSYEGS